MANTAGGEIFLGIEETKDHRFIYRGIKNPAKLQKAFWDGVRSKKKVSKDILSESSLAVLSIDGLNIVRISIPRARRQDRPIFLGENPVGNTYIRRHEGDYRADEETVRRMMAEAVEDSRDDRVLDKFSLEDLDPESISAYRNRFSAFKPNSPWLALPMDDFLTQIGVLGKDRQSGMRGLRIAGLLMFGRYNAIKEQFPYYMVDYQERPEPKKELRWIDRIVPDDTWSGNLYDFYLKTIRKLTADVKIPFRLEGATRIDDTPIHQALREALTNTLIHADYTGRVSVLVVKRPDLFGFRNPGLMRVSLEQAMMGGISDCRNHRIQDMFRYIGLGDHAGSGIPSILTSWKSQHWRLPLLYENREYEQTLLELRTSSLFPEESIQSLKDTFGDRFESLPELARVILATAETEGEVTHSRLKALTAEHPKDITAELMRLAREGFLEKHGATRASVYEIPGRNNSILFKDIEINRSMDAVLNLETTVETAVETAVEKPMSIEVAVETAVEKRASTPESILMALSEHPDWTLKQVSQKIDRSIRVVETAASQLVADGKLRHVGPKKGGHWEVLEH
jgi:predicted HTH transcriptional regulator